MLKIFPGGGPKLLHYTFYLKVYYLQDTLRIILNKNNALCRQRTHCCEKLPGLIASYFELQYPPQPPTLLFTHYPKLSFSCPPPPPPPPPSPPHHCRAKCLPACYASSKKQVSFRRLSPWAPEGKDEEQLPRLLRLLANIGALGGTAERMSSSLLRDVDKNNQKGVLTVSCLTRQEPEAHDILTRAKKEAGRNRRNWLSPIRPTGEKRERS